MLSIGQRSYHLGINTILVTGIKTCFCNTIINSTRIGQYRNREVPEPSGGQKHSDMMNGFYTRRCIRGLSKFHGREHAIIENNHIFTA
jgi:hypothetical protein